MNLILTLTSILILGLAVSGQITLKQVQEAMTQAKLPIGGMTVFDAKTDPNSLLGRPFGYLEKATWYDTRAGEKDASSECTVEIFKNAAAAGKRKKYLDAISESLPILSQYSYLRKNILLRATKILTPEQAAEYERAIKTL